MQSISKPIITKQSIKNIPGETNTSSEIKNEVFNRDFEYNNTRYIQTNQNIQNNQNNQYIEESFIDKTINFIKSERFKNLICPFRHDRDPTMRNVYYCLWMTVFCMFSYIFILLSML
jgi:hypothetical protein